MQLGLRFAGLLVVLALVFPGSALGFGPLSSVGSEGEGAGQLRDPRGIAVAADGTLFVADHGNDRVAVFSPGGGFRAFGSQLADPTDVAVDPQFGRVYVADDGNNRVDVFAASGEFLYAFGKDVNPLNGSDRCTAASGCQAGTPNGEAGALIEPTGVAVGGASVYVADPQSQRIDVYDLAGLFLFAFGNEVSPSGGSTCTPATGCVLGAPGVTAGAMSEPYDVTPTSSGGLAVTDSANFRVDVFSAAGLFLYAFGKDVNPLDDSDRCTVATGCQAGDDDDAAGAFSRPTAILSDGHGDLFVADRDNSRVAQFALEGTFERAFGEGVRNGGLVFQTCTQASGCLAGKASNLAGSIANPYGVAGDCQGAVYVSEHSSAPGWTRVERFGEAGTAPPPCVGALPTPPPIEAPAAKPPSNRFRFAGLVKNRANGSAVLYVRVPGPGRVFLFGRGVRRLARGAPRAKVVRLPVRPKIPLKRFLKEHGKGRIRVEVTFAPVGNVPRTLEKVIVLRRHRS